MRAFNLIPADERGGGGVGAGKSGGGAFVVLGLLGVLAIFALLYGEASHQISSQRGEDRDAQRPGAGGPGAGRPARAIRQLHGAARTARAGGRPARRLALRLGPRLPRTRPRAAARRSRSPRSTARSARARARPQPSRHGRGRGSKPPRDRCDDGYRRQLERRDGTSSSVVLGDARRQRPDLHAQRLRHEPGRGRADARPPAPDRRRQRSHAAELHQGGQSGGGGSSSSGRLRRQRPVFAMQIAFDPLPSASATSSPSTTSTATPSAATPDHGHAHDIHRRRAR